MRLDDKLKNGLEGKIVRYLIYRRMFTPHEQEQKYTDESFYEDNHHTIAVVRAVNELPDGDILFTMDQVNIDEDSDGSIQFVSTGIKEFVKLSEIRLYEFDIDTKIARAPVYQRLAEAYRDL